MFPTNGICQRSTAPLCSTCWMRECGGQWCSSHSILFSSWVILAFRPLPLTFYESWLKWLAAGLCTWQGDPGKLLAAISLCCAPHSSKATHLPVQTEYMSNTSFWRVPKPWTNLQRQPPVPVAAVWERDLSTHHHRHMHTCSCARVQTCMHS